MEYAIKPPDVFVFDGPNVSQRWARWSKQFETYHVAAELGGKGKKVQIAILLNAAGAEAQEIHEQFAYTDTEDGEDYKVVLKKFDTYCRPRKNVVYERHRFWNRDQAEDEPVDKWVKDLRIIAKDCTFDTQEDNMIRDKIVYGVHDKRVQERMLRDGELNLTKAIELCRAAESSRNHMMEIAKPQISVNELKASSSSKGAEAENRCYGCGATGHIARDCTRRKCFNCQGIGHYSRDCPSGDNYPKGRRRSRGRGRGRANGNRRDQKQFNEVETDEIDEYINEFSTLSLHSIQVNTVEEVVAGKPTKRYVKLLFHVPKQKKAKEVSLKIDSGAQANVITVAKFRELFPDKVDRKGFPQKRYMKEQGAILKAYGGAAIEHHGAIELPCEYNTTKFMCKFYITDANGEMLLGLPTCEALGIVKISIVSEVTTPQNGDSYIEPSTPLDQRPPIRNKADLKIMYPECFDPKGRYWKDYEYDIKIDPTVKTKIHPPRRVPLELKSKLKLKLDEMVERGILAKVDKPTKWVSSLLLRTKPNGELRICLDPTDLNEAIMRDHHPTPIIDDITPELKDSDLFTKLDLKDGYWHIKLTEEASYLTTFNSPYGRYRYLRMPFGLRMSQDVFQFKVDETYSDCDGAIGISDDITVHGKGGKNHDLRLHGAMERTRQANLCLNYDKIEVKKTSVKFFGNIFSDKGVKADPDKIAAITALRPPETKSELKTFLGMVNYLQRFIPRLAENTAPLRALEKKDVHFTWDETHKSCFEKVKSLVADSVLLAYYDRNKEATLQCDYSTQGIGVALVQEGRPIQFASKALVGGEKDYAPIEGEMLGVLYGIKKFHHYLYGRTFTVECDHKPLMQIQRKNLHMAPPRLKSMMMDVSPYDFKIKYRPGREMVLPDALSRLSQADKTEIPNLGIQIHEIVDISPSRLEQLKQETHDDVTLQKVKEFVLEGWPESIKDVNGEVRPYWSFRSDISCMEGLLMAGSRIIIPETSRAKVLQEIHEGHQGESKCMLRAKSAVYWPGIYKQIEQLVKACGTCREFDNAQPKCPMLSNEVPPRPWHTVGADLFHFKGKWYLLITDFYSKAPFIRALKGTSAWMVVRAMKSIFSENGTPEKVVSDNGTHFTAALVQIFAKKWDFQLILSSPEYPQGHGLIERHIQTVKKCMHKCDVGGWDFDKAMLVLRSTPIDVNLPSPAELLQQRKFRTSLPTIIQNPSTSDEVQEILQQKQEKAAVHYNKSAKVKAELTPGQQVRIYNKQSRRWEPAVVTGRANTPRSYVIERMSGGIPLRRNRIHLKPSVENWNRQCFPKEDDGDYDDVSTNIPLAVEGNEQDETTKGSEPMITSSSRTTDEETPFVPRRSKRIIKQIEFYQAGGR